jgi:hypothetical protein
VSLQVGGGAKSVQAGCRLRPIIFLVLEIGSTLFQLIAVVVLCALVWSLPERSREERRRRISGMGSLR